jgi:hypothetical protein
MNRAVRTGRSFFLFMEFLYKYSKFLTPLFLGTGVFLFFYFYAPGLIFFREQNYLFLYTKEFFLDHVTHPGGVASYTGAFLTQFYAFTWAGALIQATLIVLVQQSISRLMKQAGVNYPYQIFSLLPALLLWRFSCDQNYMTGSIVAILISLLCVLVMLEKRNKKGYVLRTFFLAIILYLFAGASFILYLAFILFFEFRKKEKEQKQGNPVILVTSALFLAVSLPVTASLFSPYPLEQLFLGIDFYRYPNENFFLQYAAWLVVIGTVILTARISVNNKNGLYRIVSIFLIVMIPFCGFLFLRKAVNPTLEEALEYDHLAWNQQWDKIIRKADKKPPSTSMSMTCLNLALVKSGKSGDLLFNYFQKGTEGLIPEFGGDFTSPLTTAEVFYHLGLINEAQHYVFEAMEAIPNHRKSARCLQRLVQTNLINEQYDVAQKYLGLLHKTLFYRHWARNATFENHPEWNTLQAFRLPEDRIFSSTNMSTVLKDLTIHNQKNKTAFQYLMAYTLLNKDWEKAAAYFSLGQQHYSVIPWGYQQALAFEWFQKTGQINESPWELDENIQKGLKDFMNTLSLSSETQAHAVLEKSYGHTYWYYLYFIF